VRGDVRDDGLELRHGLLDASGVDQRPGALHGRSEGVDPRDPGFERPDHRGVLVLGGLRCLQSVPLGDRGDRLGFLRRSNPLRQRGTELDDALALAADVGDHALPLLDQAAVHGLELAAHLLEITEPVGRILAHGALHDVRQPGRQGRIDLGGRRRIFRAQLLEELHRVLAEEGRP
jgi:hypothetical protein